MTEEERAEIRRIRESYDSDPDGPTIEALLSIMLRELERQSGEARLKAELARKHAPIHVNLNICHPMIDKDIPDGGQMTLDPVTFKPV